MCMVYIINSNSLYNINSRASFVGIGSKIFLLFRLCRFVRKYQAFDKVLIEHSANFNDIAIYMLIGGVLTSIAISMLQVSLSQILSPIIGYISVVALLIAGVFLVLKQL